MTEAIFATLVLVSATALAACIAWVVMRFRITSGADRAIVANRPQCTASGGSLQDAGMKMNLG
ncbi:MAG: hypothetical protein AB1714_12440 [Acidobacteriota bacterium]